MIQHAVGLETPLIGLAFFLGEHRVVGAVGVQFVGEELLGGGVTGVLDVPLARARSEHLLAERHQELAGLDRQTAGELGVGLPMGRRGHRAIMPARTPTSVAARVERSDQRTPHRPTRLPRIASVGRRRGVVLVPRRSRQLHPVGDLAQVAPELVRRPGVAGCDRRDRTVGSPIGSASPDAVRDGR